MIEYFEKRVRPVLIDRCQKCHGAKKQESGLRLDSRAGLLKGGENFGAAIRPGDAASSSLIEVLRYEGDVQMPPDRKLSEPAIASIAKWIDAGAPWPDDDPVDPQIDPAAAWQNHWASRPVTRPPVPDVHHADQVRTPVDAFVLRRLEDQGLNFATRADPRTLIRRLSFDLTGLPPTYEDVETFTAESARDPRGAITRLVDDLLDSPHYGERWGRHWLDVARYADTKGYVRLVEQPNYYYAWTYRDYVVDSFNSDLPFDQFVVEQLAADRLTTDDDNRRLAALGFLTLGRRFTGNQHDIIDDRIDVVTRGLLGLTVTCARCHDHKFDPIPTADYYSLYGVFASSREPAEPTLIGTGSDLPVFRGDMATYAGKRKPLDDLIAEHHPKLLDMLREDTTRYLVKTLDGRKPFLVPLPAAVGEIRQTFVEMWIDFLDRTSRTHDPVFAPWHTLASLPDNKFPDDARAVIAKHTSTGSERCNPLILNALMLRPLTSMQDVARTYGEILTSVHRQWKKLHESHPSATSFDDPAREELRRVLYGSGSPFDFTTLEGLEAYLFDWNINQEVGKAFLTFDGWLVGTGQAARRAHAIFDSPVPREPRIFIRGNPERPGELVERQAPAALYLNPAERSAFERGSGRLELARAIVSRQNPLTARVFVNRVWAHHFGHGLVPTTSNFGLRAEPPTHPELLDYLAAWFMDSGWSVKRLHRLIVLSSVWQQASADRPDCRAVEPENRLLWKMNRRRLDFESLRDFLLVSSGRLERTIGGRPIALTDPNNMRRSIYGHIDRSSLPGILQTFDFPSPDTHSPSRPSTSVPQQALFLMNSQFVIDQAQALGDRVRDDSDTASQVVGLYELVLGRRPDERELRRGIDFIQDPESLADFAQTLLLSNEFLFVD